LAVKWPGWRTNPWHQDADAPDIVTWAGNLVDGMRDESGQMYMRNRYYDPATGQFTQPDPIGLAGGLNSYGFAAGDPVTYSDPYGLKVIFGGETDEDKAAARRVWNDLRSRAEEARHSGNFYQRAVARDLLGLMNRAENDDEHVYTIIVTELDEEFTGGGIETTDPENRHLHLIQVDGNRQTNSVHMSPWILLAHELGGAAGWGHAIPALRAENQARTIAGCGLRFGEGTHLFPDCFRPGRANI
jgi:RHS repeat-associated protein